ncbi:helix-turn-helix transcriptional regulator [Kineococcus sp. SYSU DK002]|uniref:helix-turn-helix transcriptional regulator n=1 Tax=Kineococcus sp. SYSU DK002 TaxID=3383123 RepID=UPI003D7D0063
MLSARRAALVHRLGLELLDVRDPGEQLAAGLRFLDRVVPGDVVADVRVDSAGRPHITETPELLLPLIPADAPDVVLSSPAIPYLTAHGELPARRVEELCTPREWAANPMRRELLEPNRVPHALLTAHLTDDPPVADDLVGGPAIQCWGVNRSTPFTDADVAALGRFEPYLRLAARDRGRTALVLDLDRAVASGAGLVLFRGTTATYCNAVAADLLDDHDVPLSTLARVSRFSLGPDAPTGVLPTARGGLRLRWRPALPGSSAVVVHTAVARAGADGPALSARQLTVLGHLDRGWTAAAMAHHLHLSERTVHKHLQNLYRLLGVNDRLNAVLAGRRLGLLPLVEDRARTRPADA